MSNLRPYLLIRRIFIENHEVKNFLSPKKPRVVPVSIEVLHCKMCISSGRYSFRFQKVRKAIVGSCCSSVCEVCRTKVGLYDMYGWHIVDHVNLEWYDTDFSGN